MPYPSKHKLQLKKALESLAKKHKLNQCQKRIDKTTNHLNKTNNELDNMTSNVSNVNEFDSSK
ncbi:5593_t:CDS:1, partial [Scutellospora calospora]